MNYPTVKTKLFILLGNRLGHSVSPAMHNRAFEKLGLDSCYIPVESSSEDLETVFRGLVKMNVGGFNVTIPHKIQVMNYLDEIHELAATIGAVNTICVVNGRTIGHNTDGYGFTRSLEEQTGITPAGKRFLLLGAGGAARAISMTLAWQDAARVTITNRTAVKAKRLVDEINAKIRPCARTVDNSPEAIGAVLAECDVVVNCTSIGMSPDSEVSPLDPSLLRSNLVIADIVYNPLETKLLRQAKEAGCQTVEGLGMLIHQGAAAFTLWTGKEALVEEMAEVAYAAMRK